MTTPLGFLPLSMVYGKGVAAYKKMVMHYIEVSGSKELLSDKQWKRALLDLEISRKVKTMAKRVAYYLNQFLAASVEKKLLIFRCNYKKEW